MKFNRTGSRGRAFIIAQSRRSSRIACTAGAVILGVLFQFHATLVDDAPAQTNAITHSPAEVVQKYVQLDNKGARLDAASFESLAPYVNWKEEPLWGKVVVINGFSVPDDYRQWEVVDSLEVVIPVTFQVIGAVYLETAGFLPEPSVEEIRVRVKSVKNRWRIIEPVLPPHVGQKRMINFVKEAWVKETEPAKRESLAVLQDELRKAK